MRVYVLALSTSNYRSVIAALRFHHFDAKAVTVSQLSSIDAESIIVIPGVGNISHLCSEISTNMSIRDFRQILLSNSHYIIGICLGFQFMCQRSHEDIDSECLGLFPFDVKRIDDVCEIPSVGWQPINYILSSDGEQASSHHAVNHKLSKANFYFTHSYGVANASSKAGVDIFGYQRNDKIITAAIITERFIGFQFHPEKSGSQGLNLLKTTVECLKHV